MKNNKGLTCAALAALAVSALLLLRGAEGTVAIINWSSLHQVIDGFGASCADFLQELSTAQADFFFTTKGIGLSMLRTQIIPDTATCDREFSKGGCSDANGEVLNGELRTARLAVGRGAIVFSTPWSPPGDYKSNGSFRDGGHLLRSRYADWARDIANYVVMMAERGVPVYAVSVQNEPNLTTDYGSCLYTAEELHDFVPYLHSALESVGATSTKIIIAEESNWAIDRALPAMTDPKVAPEVGLIAAHGYGGRIQPYPTGALHLWQTENSSPSPTYDGSMGDGIAWAITIHKYLTVADVNAWVAWFLTDMPRQGEGTDNAALTDLNGNIPKRTYVIGQWSRFVRRGWYRMDIGYLGPLLISGYRELSGRSFAIVAINPTSRAVDQGFLLSEASAEFVTPWVTSSTVSLSEQDKIPVVQSRFSYRLPPSTVVTFVGTAINGQ